MGIPACLGTEDARRPGAMNPGTPAVVARGCPATTAQKPTPSGGEGTADPSPLYDWSGADWRSRTQRGTNLYTTSVIALDPDAGSLSSIIRSCRTVRGTSTQR